MKAILLVDPAATVVMAVVVEDLEVEAEVEVEVEATPREVVEMPQQMVDINIDLPDNLILKVYF